MNSIVLAPFLQSLAIQNPSVFGVSAETMAKYRALAGLKNAQYADQHSAQLLLTALLFRPSSEAELSKLWGQNRNEIARYFVLGLSANSIEITETVLGASLRQKIFEATLIRLKSDDTLENYARELSQRFSREIRFHKAEVFSPALATAFARLAVEKRQRQKQVGYETAFKRWGYVPGVELQAV